MTQNRPPEPTPPDQGDPRDQLYPPVEENFWDDRTTPAEKPSPAGMLQDLMTQAHDPTELSVTIPVEKLLTLKAEIGQLQNKAEANGRLCMEKTREQALLRAQLSTCEQALETKSDQLGKVWTLIEAWDGPTAGPGAPSREAAAKLREVLSTRPPVNAQSVLGETVEPVADVPATEEPQAEVALDRGDQTR